MREFEAGKLNVRLSREEAIGNFVDRRVRFELRRFYRNLGIQTARDSPIRVNNRAYDTSGIEVTYRVPDNRIASIGIDWTLSRKTASTKQIGGFFGSDFRPDAVVIIRPSQLGANSIYAITRPRRSR